MLPLAHRPHTQTLLAAILLCSIAPASSAQPNPSAQIDGYVRAEMARRRIPGLALMVLKDHRVVHAANYGVADLARQTPVSARTSFEIASMSKQFTDAAILLLAERGALAVTDPISKHIPELPPAWRTMTVLQLMNHTAGLPDDWDEDDRYFTSRRTGHDFLEALKRSPLRFAPGSDWSYSAGPFVLGLLIERLTGESYAQFMRRTIFQPLGMMETHVNDSSTSMRNRASGYVVRDGRLQRGVRLPVAAWSRADVGIRSTTRDLARWDAALDGATLLSTASRRLMFAPGTLDDGEVIAHGLGWFVTPFRGHTEIAHGGAFRTGFNSVIARYPDDRLTIIILTNRFGARVSQMARGIAAFYNRDYGPIATMRPRPDGDPSRTAMVARIMDALERGEHPEELLPGVGRLGGWSRSELRQELARATAPVVVDCHDLAGRSATAFGIAIVANCFYRTEGDEARYWAASFAENGRVAYLELEE